MNQVTEKERTQVGGLGWGKGGATLEYRKVSEERGYYNN